MDDFNNAYEWLYENDRYGSIMSWLVPLGEQVLRNRREFWEPLAERRGDIFTSDRELAALAYASFMDDPHMLDISDMQWSALGSIHSGIRHTA